MLEVQEGGELEGEEPRQQFGICGYAAPRSGS